MTPKYSVSSNSNCIDLDSSSALDLIRQLDQSLAEANQGIVAASQEVESAASNAHLAAEIRRRFAKPNGYEVSNNDAVERKSSLRSQFHSHMEPPQDTTTTASTVPHNNENTRLAVAHAEELVDLSSHLTHVKRQLEMEMMDHQDVQAKLSCAERTIGILTEQVATYEHRLETMQNQYELTLAEKMAELTAAQEAVRVESEDAEYAMELAKQKIAEEQEMRSLLQQVLEKNEEYRQYIQELASSTPNHTKKMVSFRDPIDDTSQRNHRMLVAKGRELLQQQRQTNESSPTKQVTHAISTCQATAAILKQSGTALGCWEDANVSISDEVQLERLAKSYVHAVELQMNQQRQNIQELESFCALLEQSEE